MTLVDQAVLEGQACRMPNVLYILKFLSISIFPVGAPWRFQGSFGAMAACMVPYRRRECRQACWGI
jgi:hypothetical protein